MEHIGIVVLIFIVIIQQIMIVWERSQAKQREDDLIAAVLANNLGEYAAAHSKIRETTKDRIKQMNVENDLAIANEKLMEERGIPV